MSAGLSNHGLDRRAVWLAQRGLAVISLVFVSGCGSASVLFTFDNQTGARLCEYANREGVAAARCLAEIRPRAETKWGRDCDNLSNRPIRIIITVKDGGRVIYDRTASCGEWNDTERRFVIEQDGNEFMVTDSFSDSMPAP
jgi:hypothetical protein